MTESEGARALIAQACRMVGKLGLTKDTAGHVSMRIGDTDRVLIRARGPAETGVRYTEPDNVITVDLDGQKVKGPDELSVPIEVFIHTALYRSSPDIRSVVHVHPPTVVLFTICDVPLLPLYGAYDPGSLRLAVDGIPRYDRSVLVSNPTLGQELAEAMSGRPACLMRGHGITTAGPSVEEAVLTAVRVNELAEMNYRARLLGEPRAISEEDLRSFAGPGGPSPKSGDASMRANALWRYYCRLLDEDASREP